MIGRSEDLRATYMRCVFESFDEYVAAGREIRLHSDRSNERLVVCVSLNEPEVFHRMLSACLLERGVGDGTERPENAGASLPV